MVNTAADLPDLQEVTPTPSSKITAAYDESRYLGNRYDNQAVRILLHVFASCRLKGEYFSSVAKSGSGSGQPWTWNIWSLLSLMISHRDWEALECL